MIGVNIEGLNSVISKLNSLSDDLNSDFSSMNDSIDKLDDCYYGTDLNSIFKLPVNGVNVRKVISQYIDTLDSVKKSYITQDEIFKGQIDHINSKLV